MCVGHKHGHRFPSVRRLFAWEVVGRRVYRCVTGSVNGLLLREPRVTAGGQPRITPNWPNLLGHRVACLRRLRFSTLPLTLMQEHALLLSAPAIGLASHSRPVYPWSAHASPLGHSAPPFPRYSHALSTPATATGELFLFGNYAHGSSHNDLCMFSKRDFSTTLLQTGGETPGATLTSTLLLVWGGVTKFSCDDSLYSIFSTSACWIFPCHHPLQLIRASCISVSREWTRIVVNGPGPGGGYFHTVTLVGSSLFVFGGQNNETCFNDIWGFDLNRCTFAPLFHMPFLLDIPAVNSNPLWESYEPAPGDRKPLPRAEHVSKCQMTKCSYLTFRHENGLSYNAQDPFRLPVEVMLQSSSMMLCMSSVGVPSMEPT